MTNRVSLATCDRYDVPAVSDALASLLEPLGGLGAFVSAGQRVILKPNYVCADPPERASVTHPVVLEALARQVLELGAEPIIADAPAWGGPRSVLEKTGIGEVCERLHITFRCFGETTSLPSVRPRVAPHFHVDPLVQVVDRVINVGKLKAHQQLGFTAATKNLYGCMPGREKAWHHCARSRTDSHFARFLCAYAASLPVTLNIVDGIVAMEGRGPRLGRPRELGVLLAGESCFAVDAVAADLIGAPPGHRLMLDAAAELDLLPSGLEGVGADLPRPLVSDFGYPELVGVFFSPWRLARGWVRHRMLLRRERRTA